jgi:formate/nitrite transporter
MTTEARSAMETAGELNAIIEKKGRLALYELILFGMLAGIYIGFGAIAASTVTANSQNLSPAVARWLAGSVFCVGLILVVIPGSELFTGNILMAAGLGIGKIGPWRLVRNWVGAYLGNFLGALLLALVVFGTGLMGTPENPSPLGKTAADIAAGKIALDFFPAFFRGVLCNTLVCLAVILSLSSRTVTGKILGIYFPIMTFVMCGFEHSVANMYFLPAGLLAKGELLSGFASMFNNLIPVTLGNIVGGLSVILLHPARVRQFTRAMKPRGG